MRLATWNINSVRLRKEIVLKLLKENKIDVLCLQETKTIDEHFPKKFFEENGYSNLYFSGEKSYNGVAIISRLKFTEIAILPIINDSKRHISVKINHAGKNIELHNFYIPAGGDIPDPNENPKFDFKLKFVDYLTNWFSKNYSKEDEIIICGDFNIAPYENDVWSHKQLLKIVSHTPIEIEKLNEMKSSINFVDIAREFISPDEKLYSWWSYRNRDWRKSNRGRRLDHIWATAPVAKMVKNFEILSDLRDWEKPSDHVPVIIDL